MYGGAAAHRPAGSQRPGLATWMRFCREQGTTRLLVVGDTCVRQRLPNEEKGWHWQRERVLGTELGDPHCRRLTLEAWQGAIILKYLKLSTDEPIISTGVRAAFNLTVAVGRQRHRHQWHRECAG